MASTNPEDASNPLGEDWKHWLNRWLELDSDVFGNYVDAIAQDSTIQFVWVVQAIDGDESIEVLDVEHGLPFEQLHRKAIAAAQNSIYEHQAKDHRIDATFFGFNRFDVSGKLGSGRTDSFWVQGREGMSRRFTARKRMFGSWDEGGDVTTESIEFPQADFY